MASIDIIALVPEVSVLCRTRHMNGYVERRDAARLEKPPELGRRKSSFSTLENDLIGDRITRFSDTFATYSICIFLN